MKVLVVTWAYAPELSPRAFRWTTVAEALAARGHHVDVVARSVAGAPPRELRGGVWVHRVGGRMGDVLRRRLAHAPAPAGTAAAAAPGAAAPPRLRAGAGAVARRVYDRTWKRLYWPDFACLWYPAALRKARALLRQHGHDRLVTVSHPFTGHLVGAALRGQAPALRWVVDVGDPFAFLRDTPPNNTRLYGGLNYRAEARVLEGADVVSVTTGPTLARYAGEFPQSAHKLVVIPPLLAPPGGGAGDGRFFPERPGRLRMVFVGTLYRHLRSPEPLLRLFRSLLATEVGARLELHFVGTLNGCEDLLAPFAPLLGDRLFCHGAVPRDRALRAMHEADVLVNLGNRSGYQLPSKVVEYAATGRPVLNLAGAPGDVSTEFFAAYPAALQLRHDDDGGPETARRVAGFLETAVPAAPEVVERIIAPFGPEGVTDAYERLLQCAS